MEGEEVERLVYVGGGTGGVAGGTPAVPAATPAVPGAGARRGERRGGGGTGEVVGGGTGGVVGGDEVGEDDEGVGGEDLGWDLKAMTHSATSDTEEYSRLPVGVV